MRLFESELGASPIGGGDDIAGEVVSAKADARAAFPLLGEGRIKIIANVVGAIPNGEKEFVTNIERQPVASFFQSRHFIVGETSSSPMVGELRPSKFTPASI